MGVITAILVLLLGALMAIGAFFACRSLVRALRPRRRTWVERSGTDRRRRTVPVTFDRRTGPRRQEDVARLFLAGIGA